MSSSRLPEPFVHRLRTILPDEWHEQVLDTFSHEKETTFRLNGLKNGNKNTLEKLSSAGIHLNPVDGVEDVWRVNPDQRDVLLGSREYENGEIYVQNASSMIPPLILAPKPGLSVLDLTAAPGSKTIQLADMVGRDGLLLAVEKVRKRFYKLQDNLQRNGAGFVKTVMADGERIWKRNIEAFDAVLIDAPCSTEGRFREDDPETYKYWSMRKIKEMVRKQSRLLFSAIQCLKPGGSLVYSTCTFAPEENEGVVNRILQQFGDILTLEEFEIPPQAEWLPGLTDWKHKQFSPQIKKARRILPDHIYEGFFVCKIKKTATTLG